MMKYRLTFAVACMVMVDLLAFCLSFGIAFFIVPFELCRTVWWIPVFCCAFFLLHKSYVKHLSFLLESVEIVKVVSVAYLLGLILFWGGTPISIKLGVTLAWLNALYLAPVFRYAGKTGLMKAHLWERTILILGAGQIGRSVAAMIDQEPALGYKILGFLTDEADRSHQTVRLPSGKEIPVIGALESVEEVAKRDLITDIILAAPDLNLGDCCHVASRLHKLVPSILLVLDLPDLTFDGEIRSFVRAPWLALHVGNSPVRYIAMKRFFDLIFGGLIFLLSLPFLILISVILKIDSQGPVFFSHMRIGRYGRPFKCLKFRTMRVNAEAVLGQLLENPGLKMEWEAIGKLKDDPRVTRIGKLLRKTSLDELPQILNVLKGDMSLVGPRPLSPRWLEKCNSHREARLQVPPGMTGLWQVSGRNDIEFSERIQLDSWYIQNWSIWLDIIILLRTVVIVLNKRGAY